MEEAEKLYQVDLAGCDASVTDVLDKWKKAMNDLVSRKDYVEF